MRALRPIAVLFTAMACSSLVAPTAGEAHPSPSPMVDMINEVRADYGVSHARYSSRLSGSSARFARHLAATHSFAHGPRIAASSRFSELGEVLARMPGWEVRRDETLERWLDSPSHRAVVLDPAYRYIGAARQRGYSDEGNPVMLWTVQFGR